jgi:hypothetical protein
MAATEVLPLVLAILVWWSPEVWTSGATFAVPAMAKFLDQKHSNQSDQAPLSSESHPLSRLSKS